MSQVFSTYSSLILVTTGVLALVALTAFLLISKENNEYRKTIPFATYNDNNAVMSTTLVVYYSRSGYTKLMAIEIARIQKGKLIEIINPTYALGLKGYINAGRDAHKKEAIIMPSIVDLSAYDTIYIGSPIWLSSPAPAVWSFIKQNKLMGKKVILFSTSSSKFNPRYIEEFSSLVCQQGGAFVKHIYILRTGKASPTDILSLREEVKKRIG